MKWNETKVEKEKIATAVDLARAIVSATSEEGEDNLKIKDATKTIRGLRDGILSLVASGYREIKLGNIAIIKVAVMPEYTAKNPKTGAEILVPDKLRAVAKFSKTAKKMISEMDINIGNDVIVQITKDKAERSEKAKKVYASRVANGKTFGKKTIKA